MNGERERERRGGEKAKLEVETVEKKERRRRRRAGVEERREEVGAWKKERRSLEEAEWRAKWLPPFQELSRCRKSGRVGAGSGEEEGAGVEVAAVGRKFKIEYLASNFHRS